VFPIGLHGRWISEVQSEIGGAIRDASPDVTGPIYRDTVSQKGRQDLRFKHAVPFLSPSLVMFFQLYVIEKSTKD
jgi:hypothetical protein